MRAVFKAEKPGDIEMTVTLTMPLKKWKDLRAQLLESQWPASDFGNMIRDVVRKAEESFYSDSNSIDF